MVLWKIVWAEVLRVWVDLLALFVELGESVGGTVTRGVCGRDRIVNRLSKIVWAHK